MLWLRHLACHPVDTPGSEYVPSSLGSIVRCSGPLTNSLASMALDPFAHLEADPMIVALQADELHGMWRVDRTTTPTTFTCSGCGFWTRSGNPRERASHRMWAVFIALGLANVEDDDII